MVVFFRRFLFAAMFSLAAVAVLPAAEGESKPRPPVDAKRIVELIAQLGADDYFLREKAQAELAEVGAAAFDVLSEEAEKTRDVETAERVAYLLRTVRITWVDEGDPNEVRSLLQNYEGMDDEVRQRTIEALAALPDPIALTALCRIVRFEKSQVLSKWAATRILEQKTNDETDWKRRDALLRAALDGSPRPAAAWVRSYLLTQTDPQAGVAELQKQTDAEEAVLRQYPQRSKPEIVMSLLRRQSELFKKLERPREAAAALVRMVTLDPDSTTVLVEVIQSLIDRQAWNELDQVVVRFADRIQQEPLVAYTVARAYQLQNRTKETEQFVEAARKMFPDDQRRHIFTALELHRRGLNEWSDAEYRLSIGMGRPTDRDTITAQVLFGESLHDRRLDKEAAKVLDDATNGMTLAAGAGIDLSDAGRGLEANRARAHYFHAAHFEAQNNSKEQIRHLLEGLGEDSHDTEILIALYRAKGLDETVLTRVKKLIAETADSYRAEIKRMPDDDTPYNQLAWLISNTEGDYQEALNASKKSLEIKPDNPGHLDTLGRCYFAMKDYENAVKTQSRAIELDPHSQQMKRQLAEFQAALEKQQKK